jgi:hypothetical protein
VPIRLDGALAGRTDAFGFAVVSAAAVPRSLSVDLPGFVVERAELLAADQPAARRRGHVMPVVLRPGD